MSSSVGDDSSVKVAIRIRPQLAREKLEGSRICTFVAAGESQVTLGKDKHFTYDFVFDIHQTQSEIYNGSVSRLVDGCFDGFNATVIAYGQTGAGKTHTMGTGFEMNTSVEQEGMIPRALRQIFDGIILRQQKAEEEKTMRPEFSVSVQFMEIYNEEILDLMNTSGNHRKIRIHEDQFGNIVADGLEESKTESYEATMKLLQAGALNRTTASTKMNTQSSRSHAVFTLNISQTRSVVKAEGEKEVETVCSKFHFVDLAGSERLKRTGATGDRAKEGIAINGGLLALGNVISALGDKSKKTSHIPYRDSKITRLLQDSLGGNSRTIMIACISPSDSDFMETLNTLKYANRARNIKNKVSRNQDSTSKQLAILREQLQQALAELASYKNGLQPGIQSGGGDIHSEVNSYNDMFQENNMLQQQIKQLKNRIAELQATIDLQKERLVQFQMNNVNVDDQETNSIIQNYIGQIEELNNKLAQAEARAARPRIGSARESFLSSSSHGVLEKARRALETQRLQSDSTSTLSEDENDDDLEDIENHIEDNEELKILETKVTKRKEEIADISEQISLNEELVVELEMTMANLEAEMEHQRRVYESKLKNLEEKIKQAETERDIAIKQSQSKDDSTNPKIKEMSDKINKYKNDLKMLSEQNRDNERKAKSEQLKQKQLNEVRDRLNQMKKQKVDLVKQMKEEAKLAREKEKEARNEIIKIKKEMRRSETLAQKQGTKLQSQDEQLKKQKLEILNLKKKMKDEKSKEKKFNNISGNVRPKQTESKVRNGKIWKDVQARLVDAILAKESMHTIEFDLERLMAERKQAESEQSDTDHIQYLTQRIDEAQTQLCELEDDEPMIQPSELGKTDLMYIINQLLPHFINHQSQANIENRQLKMNLRKLRVKIDEDTKKIGTQEQLISHLMKPNQNNTLSTNGRRTKKRSNISGISKDGFLALNENVTEIEEDIDPGSPVPQIRSKTIKVREKDESSSEPSTPRSNSSKLGNVWSRLTGSANKEQKLAGKILPYVNADDNSGTNISCQAIMLGHRKSVIELMSPADGQYLISSSKDKSIRVWNLDTEKEIGEINLSHTVNVIEYQNYMLYLAVSNKLHIFDISISFEKELKIIQEIKNINFVRIDAKNRLFTVQEKTIKCYESDFDNGKSLRFQSISEITAFIVIDDDGRKSNLIIGCRDHSIKQIVHNYDTGITSEVQTFDTPHLDTVTGLTNLNGFIYSVSRDHSIIKWNENGKLIKQVKNLHADWIINIKVMPKKNLIITNSRDGSVKVWEPSTIECLASINPECDVTCSISANSTTIFTGAQSKNIKIWKLDLPNKEGVPPFTL